MGENTGVFPVYVHGRHAQSREPAAKPGGKPINQVFYCHGFGSCFDPSKSKVKTLNVLTKTIGVTVDYTRYPHEVLDVFVRAVGDGASTLFVGTSLGGFYAAWLASVFEAPFVAINPSLYPHKSLRKYIGSGTTYYGSPYVLYEAVVDAYQPLHFRDSKDGLIALDMGDEIIDSFATLDAVGDQVEVVTFEGGSHRFDHMDSLVQKINRMFFNFRG